MATSLYLVPPTAVAEDLTSVPQLNTSGATVFVPQVTQQPKRIQRSAPRRVAQVRRAGPQPARSSTAVQTRIVDFGESTEALGFRLPSVRQGVRIIAR